MLDEKENPAAHLCDGSADSADPADGIKQFPCISRVDRELHRVIGVHTHTHTDTNAHPPYLWPEYNNMHALTPQRLDGSMPE